MGYDINNVTICGRLTKDPELSMSNAGKEIANFSIASNRGNDASFFDVVCFEKTAQAVNSYTKKGSQVIVSGSLDQSRWQSKDGKNMTKIKIVANNIQFIGNKQDNNNGYYNQPASNPGIQFAPDPEPAENLPF